MLLCIVWTAMPCASQKPPAALAGIDLALAMRGIAGLQFGYGFAGHWSAEAGITVDLRQPETSAMNEKETHEAEFGAVRHKRGSSEYCTGSLSVRYWPEETFRKAFIGIGAIFDMTGKADMILAAGYTFRVRKDILLTASYGICPTEYLHGKTETPAAAGISLSVSYNF